MFKLRIFLLSLGKVSVWLDDELPFSDELLSVSVNWTVLDSGLAEGWRTGAESSRIATADDVRGLVRVHGNSPNGIGANNAENRL